MAEACESTINGREKRKLTIPQTAEPKRQNSKKAEALSNLADCVLPEERLASREHCAKKIEFVAVKTAILKDAIAGIPNLIEDIFSGMIAFDPDDDKPYGGSHLSAIMDSKGDKLVSRIWNPLF